MRILFVHNYYRSSIPSGENKVVDAEVEMLRAHGHEVDVFRRDNDAIRKLPVLGGLLALVSMVANPFAAIALRRRIRSFKPDVVHVHNLFPLISPLALLAVGKIPCVMTLHNYRLFCAGETVCRGGRPCTICLEARSVRGALRHKCYRNSLLATASLALSIWLYRALGFLEKKVDRFVVLTEFQGNMVTKAGIPHERIVVKPNFITGTRCEFPCWSDREACAVYVGRISREKGCEVLIRAWNLLGENAPKLLILGEGEDKTHCMAINQSDKVSFCGLTDHNRVVEILSHSKLLVVPSVCYETFGMVVAEAFMVGTPVIVSNIGSLPEMVKDAGLVFESGSPESLVTVFKEIWKDDAKLEQMGIKARERYLQSYTAEVNYRNQLDLYNEVVRENANRR